MDIQNSATPNRELARKLDYTLYSQEERVAFVTQLLGSDNWEERLAEKYGQGVTDNSPVAQQLETLANFILYGKRTDTNKNEVESKSISQPPTRYATFTRKAPLSLDELTDSPTFDEQETRPVERNSYLNPKRTIARPVYAKDAETGELLCLNPDTNDASIAGMADLWESIDRLEWLAGKQQWSPEPYSKRTYIVDGRPVFRVNHPVREDADGNLYVDSTPPPTPPKLSSLSQYRLKHWLIDQKKHQYYLKESDNPTAFAQHYSFTPPTPVDWEEDSGYWLTLREAHTLGKKVDLTRVRWRPIGSMEYAARASDTPAEELYAREDWGKKLVRGAYVYDVLPEVPGAHAIREYFHLVSAHTLDFTDPLHVYALLEHYRDLRVATHDKLNSQMRHILDAFQNIVNHTELHESRDIILYYKIHKWTNERIARELEEFGYSYAVNYISTIYKREICVKIARQARVMDEEWAARDNPHAWRRCSECGANKLANNDNYTSKPKNYGGLSYRCKACDKLVRERRKEA